MNEWKESAPYTEPTKVMYKGREHIVHGSIDFRECEENNITANNYKSIGYDKLIKNDFGYFMTNGLETKRINEEIYLYLKSK